MIHCTHFTESSLAAVSRVPTNVPRRQLMQLQLSECICKILFQIEDHDCPAYGKLLRNKASRSTFVCSALFLSHCNKGFLLKTNFGIRKQRNIFQKSHGLVASYFREVNTIKDLWIHGTKARALVH